MCIQNRKKKELSAQHSEPSTKDVIHQLLDTDIDSFGKLEIKNIIRLFIDTLNINFVSSKFHQLKRLLLGIVDILALTESKLDSSFPMTQFLNEGYSKSLQK